MSRTAELTAELKNKKSKEVIKKEDAPSNTMRGILKRIEDEASRIIRDEKILKQVQAAMFNELRKNQNLLQIALGNPTSFLIAVYNATKLNLPIGDVNGLCHLIPYGKSVEFQLNYKGYLELLRRTGEVKDIYAYLVFENDEFEYALGLHRDIRHVPNVKSERNEAKITHCYAVVEFKNGGLAFECLTKDEIDHIRDTSTSNKGNTPAWKNHYGEMAKKTVIKRLLKTLPISSEDLRKVVEIENMAEEGKAQEFIDEAIQAELKEQTLRLTNDGMVEAGPEIKKGGVNKVSEMTNETIDASNVFESHEKEPEVIVFAEVNTSPSEEPFK